MEHPIEGLVAQRSHLGQQRAGARLDPRVGAQIGGRLEQVGEHELPDRLAGQRAAGQQRARQAGTEETGRAGDEQFHGRDVAGGG